MPVYKIPVEFRRIEPLAKPVPRTWDFPRPRVRWTFDTGAAVWAGIEHDAASGLIFVANDAGTLHALDAKGAQRWQFATGKPIKARPAAIGDSVYVASDSGFLYKLDKRSGAERWRAKIDRGSPERIPPYKEGSRWDRYGSSIVADSKRVYVGSRDNTLYAFDRATGKEQWRVQTQDMMTATPALYRDLVLFADYKGIVQAVGASDGKARWTYDARLPVAGDLVVDADRVFVGSRTYDLIALECRERQRAVEALLLVLVDRIAAGRARRRRLHRLLGRRRRIRNRCTGRQAALESGGAGLGVAADCSRRGAGRRSDRWGWARIPARARDRSSPSIAQAARSAGCTSSRRARKRWRRRLSGASQPRRQ